MITITQIVEEAAKAYDISASDILGHGRTTNVSRARGMAIYLSRKLTHKQCRELAKAFNKTNEIIYYHRDKIQKELDSNPNGVYAEAYRTIKNKLNIINNFDKETCCPTCQRPI